MGAIISRWRKKKSTVEELEGLEEEIESLQKVKQQNLDLQKKIIGTLLLYSIVGYIIAGLLFYFYYMPERWQDKLLYSTPLLTFPLIIWLLKRIFHWYFVKRISKNESALEELKDRKKQMLNEVMEKETYKKAKEILEKFDPENYKKLEPPPGATPMRTPQGQEIRQRSAASRGAPNATPSQPPKDTKATPGPSTGPPGTPMSQANMSQQRGPLYGRPPGPPMPRPILPRECSTADKLIEYLLGDGPQNRYALICKQCHSHNGMALKEEFEYLSFRCCYCYVYNAAKKQRPQAPQISSPAPSQVSAPNRGNSIPRDQPGSTDLKEQDKVEGQESGRVTPDSTSKDTQESTDQQEVKSSSCDTNSKVSQAIKDKRSFSSDESESSEL
ncbi:unnamed protein product [Owenia fusiformis]|uniref:Endoplasmic reticulum junction formation protein lunapark n=1 Tax=Owenia fusiformis TaxID=6347 RepID=A0A8J1U9H9_OWEFU|nr:unnamed protein product [Owenia fusiformis]